MTNDDVKALIAKARAEVSHIRGMEHESYYWVADLIDNLADALEAATVAPAVDREALVEWFRWHADPNDVADALLASGLLRDVRDVQAEALEDAADKLPQMAGWQQAEADTIALAQKRLRGRAQAIREARNG